MDETNFIIYMKSRNKKALHFIMRKYAWIVKSVVAKHLDSCKEFQERCIEEVFFAIWQNIECYDEWGSTFENWVAGVARFLALQYKREYLDDLRLSKETREIIEAEYLLEMDFLMEGLDARVQKIFSENIFCALNDVKTSSNNYDKLEVTKKELKKWEILLRKRLEENQK